MHFVTSTLLRMRNSSLYFDLTGCVLLCHPDMFVSIGKTTLYMIELTIGFETSLNSSRERKYEKYLQLSEIFLRILTASLYKLILKTTIGSFSNSCEPFIDMCKELKFG